MSPPKMTMSEMTALAKERGQKIYGFAISAEIWEGLRPKLQEMFGREFKGNGPHMGKETPFIIDRTLGPTEFDAAFTEKGWAQRVAAMPEDGR